MARVLVTGARGTLGQDLCARLALFDMWDVVGTSTPQLDFTWEASWVQAVLDDLAPEIIVNTAAFTHVDDAESQFETAMQLNAHAPRTLAQWVRQNKAYLIHISTDYVFEGTHAPYRPLDPTHPINRYGVSKKAGEEAIQEEAPENSLVLRTSWLFGPGGRNFVAFVLDAAQAQRPIQVTTDQWGTPTWTGNLCKMIVKALQERPVGILHGCSQGSTTRYEQAQLLCELMDLPTEFMTPVETSFFEFPAHRPHNTTMETSFESALDWRVATERYLETQGLLKHHV